MKFTLIKSHEKGTQVPNIVFESLSETRNNDLKVILYALKNDIADPLQIAASLEMSYSSVHSSLLLWADKGLFYCEEEKATGIKKRKSLTSEIIAKYSSDKDIIALTTNLQNIFGAALNEKYTNKFISLYLEDGIPVDVILLITQHHLDIKIDNPAYIIKIIVSWHSKLGLSSGAKVDEYLALCLKREDFYLAVCKIFSFDITKLTSSEKTIIDRWDEKYKMSLDMIEQSFLRAGNLANIQYCNGILKAWSQKGYSKVSDLAQEISNITQTPKNIDFQEDVLSKWDDTVPKFNK